MTDRQEISLEDQLQIANFLIIGLQQQVARYEFTFTQNEQRTQHFQEIIQLQKQSIDFLEGMLNRVEGVFQTQIDKQKVLNEKMKKELKEAQIQLTAFKNNKKSDGMAWTGGVHVKWPKRSSNTFWTWQKKLE